MKSVSPAMAAHLSQDTTNLCRMLRIDRTDGLILRFTDFDQDIFFNDNPAVFSPVVQWLPFAAGTTPWWDTTDVFIENSFAGDTGGSHFTYFGGPEVGWGVSQMFNGFSFIGNAGFLGTASVPPAGATFETVASLHADNIQASGGLKFGLATGLVWAGADNFIGFELVKSSFAPWSASTWQLKVSNGSSNTFIDSGVSNTDIINNNDNSGPRTIFKFVVSDDGTAVSFYINNVFVGSINSGLPTINLGLANAFTSNSSGGSLYYRTEGIGAFAFIAPPGGTYKSSDGLEFTALEHKSDGSPNNMQATGFLQSGGMTEQDVRARLYDSATFTVRAVNWSDLTMGDMKMLSGTVGDIQMKNGQFQLELRGWTQKLTTLVGSLYGPLCRAELFGGGAEGIDPTNHWKCRLNRADWVQNGTVLASPDSITVIPVNSASLAEQLLMIGSTTPTTPAPAGWFNDGIISFTSGVLMGYSFEIATWDGASLVLFGGGPMPQSPSPGDTFEIEPGCDKTKPTCFSKFNNVVNHAGEADIPGLNVIGAVSRTQVPNS